MKTFTLHSKGEPSTWGPRHVCIEADMTKPPRLIRDKTEAIMFGGDRPHDLKEEADAGRPLRLQRP